MAKNMTSELCAYKIEQVDNGCALLDDSSNPVTTHLGSDYPPLPAKTIGVLVEDINEIINDAVYFGAGVKQRAMQPSEVLIHADRVKIRKEQEKMSFCVCVENTLIEMEEAKDFKLPLQHLIHWDTLYRMSPDPHAKMDQMAACEQAIAYLGKDWKDLPANYCKRLEEMEVEGVPFVAAGLIRRLTDLMDEMTGPEIVAVWFLYEFFQRFSITIPLLWVKGLVDNETLNGGYYALASGFSENEIEMIKKEEGDFVNRRLMYLNKYLMVKIETEKQTVGKN